MLSNIDVLPKPIYIEAPKATEHTLVEIYPGSFRIAGGKSVSVVTNTRLQSPELPDLNLYNNLYGDRSMIIEGNLNGWKRTGEVNQSVTTTSGVKDIGIIVDFKQHLVDGKLNKWVSNIHYHGPVNKLGQYLSKSESLRQAYINLKQTPEHKRFVKFLKSKGCKEPAELEKIAVGFIGKALAAASTDGKILYANKEFQKLLIDYAERYDIDPEVLREYALGFHEQTHRFGIKGDVRGEGDLEALIVEFFEGLAKGEFDGAVMGHGRSLRSKNQKYIDIIRVAATRYGEASKNYGTFLSAIFQEYFSAAIAEGLSEEDARGYALKKTAEEADKIKDKDSDKEKKDGDKDSDKDDGKDDDEKEEDSEESDEGGEESE
jgi:hypothetical protein